MADNPIQAEIRELQNQINHLRDALSKQGDRTVGQIRERTSAALHGAQRTAEDAAEYARSEAASVAGVMREHPAATSTALLTAGLIGGVIGYFIGVAAHHEQHVHRRWY